MPTSTKGIAIEATRYESALCIWFGNENAMMKIPTSSVSMAPA